MDKHINSFQRSQVQGVEYIEEILHFRLALFAVVKQQKEQGKECVRCHSDGQEACAEIDKDKGGKGDCHTQNA